MFDFKIFKAVKKILHINKSVKLHNFLSLHMHTSLYTVNIYLNRSIHQGKPDGKFRDRIHIMKRYFDRF